MGWDYGKGTEDGIGIMGRELRMGWNGRIVGLSSRVFPRVHEGTNNCWIYKLARIKSKGSLEGADGKEFW